MKDQKILIIVADDEDDLREIFSIALSSHGFEVLEAKNGEEVFEWLKDKHRKVAGVILDIVMPKMDGFEVLEKMKKEELYCKIPVIVTSNLDSEADRREAFAFGASEYFEKVKWKPSALAIKIKEILASKK